MIRRSATTPAQRVGFIVPLSKTWRTFRLEDANVKLLLVNGKELQNSVITGVVKST